MIKIAYSSVYKYSLPEGHRFPMEKYELIPQQLLLENVAEQDQFFEPEKLTMSQLEQTHCSSFLNKLESLSLTRKEIRDIGFPVSKSLIERGKVISGGTYQCAQYALEHGLALNIAGGTHHSFRDRGEGFCIYNDFAIAANLLLNTRQIKQVLIVDLDVHQGNGTAALFKDNPNVFTFSMHGKKNYPLRKEISDMDIALPDQAGDDLYLSNLKKSLATAIDLSKPDIIMYLSGVDILKTDKLGRLAVTKKGCFERDRFIFKNCFQRGIPVTVSMGGGYSEKLADIVDAHTNTFKAAAEFSA